MPYDIAKCPVKAKSSLPEGPWGTYCPQDFHLTTAAKLSNRDRDHEAAKSEIFTIWLFTLKAGQSLVENYPGASPRPRKFAVGTTLSSVWCCRIGPRAAEDGTKDVRRRRWRAAASSLRWTWLPVACLGSEAIRVSRRTVLGLSPNSVSYLSCCPSAPLPGMPSRIGLVAFLYQFVIVGKVLSVPKCIPCVTRACRLSPQGRFSLQFRGPRCVTGLLLQSSREY